MLVYSIIQNCYIRFSEAHFKVPKFKRPKAWNKFLRAQAIFINKELNEDEIMNDQNETVRTKLRNKYLKTKCVKTGQEYTKPGNYCKVSE